VVELDGARARSTCNVRAYHRWADGEGRVHTMEIGGVYRDELVGGADGWRIAERVLEVRWRDGVANLPSGAGGTDGSRVAAAS